MAQKAAFWPFHQPVSKTVGSNKFISTIEKHICFYYLDDLYTAIAVLNASGRIARL